ncbi:hypothetical protein HPB51_000159 [Rhipicephalus microplus]|uniref:C2H2-type domain-containing protein n=1 Tax=Rhipicephalus microplus TaxID=6941 RepID=A0A9J6EPQ5_RHIMP|nr:hypothetical protein HPB51_000159 [Rhipicephalus microplus]
MATSKQANFKLVTHVIFDLDGVVLDKVYTAAVEEVAGRYGKTCTWELKKRVMGMPDVDVARIVIDTLGLLISQDYYLCELYRLYKNLLPNSKVMPGVPLSNGFFQSVRGCRRDESKVSVTMMTQGASAVQDKASPVVTWKRTGARPKVPNVQTTQVAPAVASRNVGEVVNGSSSFVTPDIVPQCGDSMARGDNLMEGPLDVSPVIALESSVGNRSSTGMNTERPRPPRLMDLLSDSSDEDVELQHHTCKDCGRAFSSLVSLSQHRRHAHFNADNADIVIHRDKPRWSKKESFLLVKKEVELIRDGVKNLNQELHRCYGARTFDSIKPHRHNTAYRNLVRELLGDSAVSKPQSPHIHTPPPGWGVEEPVDSRQACLNEIRRLVSTASPRSFFAPVLWEVGKRLLDGKNVGMDWNNYIRQNFYRDRKSPPQRVFSAAVPSSNRKKRKQEYAQLQQMFRKDQARAGRQVLDGQISCQVDDPDSFLRMARLSLKMLKWLEQGLSCLTPLL